MKLFGWFHDRPVMAEKKEIIEYKAFLREFVPIYKKFLASAFLKYTDLPEFLNEVRVRFQRVGKNNNLGEVQRKPKNQKVFLNINFDKVLDQAETADEHINEEGNFDEFAKIALLKILAHEFSHVMEEYFKRHRTHYEGERGMLRAHGIEEEEDMIFPSTAISEDMAVYLEGIFLRYLVNNKLIDISEETIVRFIDSDTDDEVIKEDFIRSELPRMKNGQPLEETERSLVMAGFNCKNPEEEIRLLFYTKYTN
jgi:hypothetical protein